MMPRDDFEHHLSQGLKRWAQSGRPTLDLEALVHTRLDGPAEPPAKPGRRRWVKWIAAPGAAALLLLAGSLSFPVWAGAAAGWPIVGPAVTEIILKDAGLKWAYDNGLVQGTVAQLKEGDLTVKILGIMADSRRTTVIYQVQGAPGPQQRPGDARPTRASDTLLWDRPPLNPVPQVIIGKVDGQGAASWWAQQPVWTPIGYVGAVATTPLPEASAELELGVRIGGKALSVTVTASRAEIDRFSREAASGQSQEIDGIKITLKSVTYTPAETVVETHVEAPTYWGGVQWDPQTESHYVESGGKRLAGTSNAGGAGGQRLEAFPAKIVQPARLVIPMAYKGVDVKLSWPLQEGSSQEYDGTVITLTRWERSGERIAFEWSARPKDSRYIGVAGFEVVDAEGRTYAFKGWRGESNWADPQSGTKRQTFEGELPADVQPVAVRATQVGVKVFGPWVFDLPR